MAGDDNVGGSPNKRLDGAFVAAIDFGGSKTAIAIADPDGRLLRQLVIPSHPDQPADAVLSSALAGTQAMMRQAISSGYRYCAGIGISTPGIPTPSGTLLSPNIAGWDHVPLRDRVQDELGANEVVLGNDVKCGALAELRWGALHGADPGVYVNLGTGVGAAVVVDGHVLEGAHGCAGEIGYSTVATTFAKDEARSLEDIVGGRGLSRTASELLGQPITAEELFDATDATAGRLVAQALAALAAHLSNIVLLLDPQRVVVGGGLMAAAQRILPALRAGLQVPPPLGPEVVASRFPTDASLRGAVALALAHTRGHGANLDGGSPGAGTGGRLDNPKGGM